jgi:hypothetical protein
MNSLQDLDQAVKRSRMHCNVCLNMLLQIKICLQLRLATNPKIKKCGKTENMDLHFGISGVSMED